MEIRRRLDPKIIFVGFYVFMFALYLLIGLQPVEATNYEISTEVSVPSIGLVSDVTNLHLENRELKTPSTIVGSFSRAKNKTLLIGHASTVFKDLDRVQIGDEIIYDEDIYIIYSVEIIEKADIEMDKLLVAEEEPTLVVMTCAGTDLGQGDATHRLIISARVSRAG